MRYLGSCIAVGVTLFSLATTACNPGKKVNECKGLIEVINAGVEGIRKSTSVTPDAGAAVAELRLLADAMEKIADDTGQVELSLPELTSQAGEYQKMAREVATAARELATAVEEVDMKKMTDAQSRMEKAVKREDPLLEGINKFCRTP